MSEEKNTPLQNAGEDEGDHREANSPGEENKKFPPAEFISETDPMDKQPHSESEEQNIPQQNHQKQSTDSAEEENQKLSQREAIPEILISESQPKDMETHAHHLHKAPGHGWTHYLFEFLMLFFAIFLGFLAENWREQFVEKERARELAMSFYNELRGDSASFQVVLENRARKNASFSYLKKYFRDSSLTTCSKAFSINFCYCFATFSPSVFQPRDAILEQLKNSGSLRYFKSPELQKLTGDLSVNIADLRSRNRIELDFIEQNMLPFFVQHNDQQWLDKMGVDSNAFLVNTLRKYEHSNEEIPFYFSKADNFDRSAATNLVGLYQIIFRGSLLNQYHDYRVLNSTLLETLRREYHIK